MAKIPDLVKVQEKWGDKGFSLFAVSQDDPGRLETFISSGKGKGMNYFVGICPDKTMGQDYDIKFLPTSYLLGPDGKVIQQNPNGAIPDSEIEKLVATLAPRKVGKAVAKDAKKAAEAFDKGEFGSALKETQKILDEANAAKYDDGAKEDAKFIVSLVERWETVTTSNIERWVSEREFLDMQRAMPDLRKRFKGLPFDETLKEKEKLLKGKEAKAEIKAMTTYEALAKEYNGASGKSKDVAKLKVEAFIKANDESKAAEKARKLIG